MSTKRNGPAGNGTGSEEVLAGGPNGLIIPDVADVGSRLSDSERDRYEARLLSWLEGWHARDDELARLAWEVAVWYFCASNRGKRPGDYYRQMTDELWREASK